MSCCCRCCSLRRPPRVREAARALRPPARWRPSPWRRARCAAGAARSRGGTQRRCTVVWRRACVVALCGGDGSRRAAQQRPRPRHAPWKGRGGRRRALLLPLALRRRRRVACARDTKGSTTTSRGGTAKEPGEHGGHEREGARAQRHRARGRDCKQCLRRCRRVLLQTKRALLTGGERPRRAPQAGGPQGHRRRTDASLYASAAMLAARCWLVRAPLRRRGRRGFARLAQAAYSRRLAAGQRRLKRRTGAAARVLLERAVPHVNIQTLGREKTRESAARQRRTALHFISTGAMGARPLGEASADSPHSFSWAPQPLCLRARALRCADAAAAAARVRVRAQVRRPRAPVRLGWSPGLQRRAGPPQPWPCSTSSTSQGRPCLPLSRLRRRPALRRIWAATTTRRRNTPPPRMARRATSTQQASLQQLQLRTSSSTRTRWWAWRGSASQWTSGAPTWTKRTGGRSGCGAAARAAWSARRAREGRTRAPASCSTTWPPPAAWSR